MEAVTELGAREICDGELADSLSMSEMGVWRISASLKGTEEDSEDIVLRTSSFFASCPTPPTSYPTLVGFSGIFDLKPYPYI